MVEIPRVEKGKTKTPGTWVKILSDGIPIAMLTCPVCGFTAGLGNGSHDISDDGTVTPSVVCDGYITSGDQKGPCPWHEFVKLKDWSKVS